MTHRVIETRTTAHGQTQRYRSCGNCKQTFTTIETVAVYAGRSLGWLTEKADVPEVQEKPKKPERFHPAQVEGELQTADKEVAENLLEWWNVSRWSKNKSKAAWTRKAWLLNVRRVLDLPPTKALALSQAGVEKGWQSLEASYIDGLQTQASTELTPRNEAMQAAIDQMSWR